MAPAGLVVQSISVKAVTRDHAEGLQFHALPTDDPLRALTSCVRREVLVGDVAVEHVVGGYQDRVFDGLARFGMSASSAEPLELGAQVRRACTQAPVWRRRRPRPPGRHAARPQLLGGRPGR